MFQKQTPKITEEPENRESANSDKEQKDIKKKNAPEKAEKHDDGHCHPALDYDTYKRPDNIGR